MRLAINAQMLGSRFLMARNKLKTVKLAKVPNMPVDVVTQMEPKVVSLRTVSPP